MWSREQNRAPGSSPAPPECGPRREIMVLGQALMAGSMVQGAKPCPRVTPSPGMVQGEKLRPRVKPVPARVWSREQNRAPGSPPAPPECGLGRETAAPGHPVPAKVWSREPNCGPGSPPAPPKYGPGSQTAAPGHPRPRRSVV